MEGSKVRYVGDDIMVGISTIGRVLSAAGVSAHVQWLEGNRQGQVDLVSVDELVPFHEASAPAPSESVAAQFEHSLEHTALLTVAVRDVYDESGEDGLITALDEAGHLATLTEHAEEAIATVAGRLRKDPTFSMVLAQLDEFEAESLLSRVAVSLLRGDDD